MKILNILISDTLNTQNFIKVYYLKSLMSALKTFVSLFQNLKKFKILNWYFC